MKRIISAVLGVCLGWAGLAIAEVKPLGQYITTPPINGIHKPADRYRTTLGYSIASAFTFQMAIRESLFGNVAATLTGTEQLQMIAIKRGQADFAAHEGLAGMAYSAALAQDLSQLYIRSLDDNRLSLAWGTMPYAIMSDVAASCLVTNIPKLISPSANLTPRPISEALGQLEQSLLAKGEQNVAKELAAARLVLTARDMRYAAMMKPMFRKSLALQVGQNLTETQMTELLSESVLATVIGDWAQSFGANTEYLLVGFRDQLIRDVATYQCPCAMNPKLNGPPVGWIFGSRGTYLTRLGYLMSQQLAPAWNPVINTGMAGAVTELMADERADIAKKKAENPAAYSTYMRAFLIDLETLEKEQIKAIQSGAAMSFIEGVTTNVVFGLMNVAMGGGTFAAAATIIANAGYGAWGAYDDYSEELQIRIAMSAMRELVMQDVIRHGTLCGCGAGVVPKPVKAIHGQGPSQ
ncbi:hypothetical protein [Roseovarius pelagicus]|uniref:Uncharacterized protein n=1 Tax=Roseovarius pelagicus TaxID=2980108 RepID=A0ABY6DBM5_9RHOB|nr:hypothetical protein [Roseovarius pelagicus]UXX82408.1 hypothetical protein N7U68_15065 [Roseovarius pelagicus]